MNEQDEKWITKQVGVFAPTPLQDDIRAAIAYGRSTAESTLVAERDGLRARAEKAEGDLDILRRMYAERVAERDDLRRKLAEVERENDRLTERVVDLDIRCRNQGAVRVPNEVNLGRLSALEARVTGLVEAMADYYDVTTDSDGAAFFRCQARLAALRGTGEAPTVEQVRERLKGFRTDWADLTPEQRAKFDAYDGPLNCGAPGPFVLPEEEPKPDHRNEGPGGCVPWEEAERLRADLDAQRKRADRLAEGNVKINDRLNADLAAAQEAIEEAGRVIEPAGWDGWTALRAAWLAKWGK